MCLIEVEKFVCKCKLISMDSALSNTAISGKIVGSCAKHRGHLIFLTRTPNAQRKLGQRKKRKKRKNRRRQRRRNKISKGSCGNEGWRIWRCGLKGV